MVSTVKAFMAVEDLAMGAGAKAAAEPIREAITSFIILNVLFCRVCEGVLL